MAKTTWLCGAKAANNSSVVQATWLIPKAITRGASASAGGCAEARRASTCWCSLGRMPCC